MNQVLTFNKDEFDAAVRAKVEEALSDKEANEAQRVATEALAEAKATFEQLKASLEAKDAKLAEYEEMFAGLETSPSAAEVAANEKIVALELEVEKLYRRSEVAEAALETIAREETAATRMSELEEVGIALDDEAAETQYSKVRGMSDEEFASYISELSALKSKYATTSAEEETEEVETAELSAEEISLIAQSLGCKPEESDCIALVQEVAVKMAEISKSKSKKGKFPFFFMKKDEKKGGKEADCEKSSEETKEVASERKLSLGEAISKATDQEIRVSKGLKEQLSQAWEERIESKRSEKK